MFKDIVAVGLIKECHALSMMGLASEAQIAIVCGEVDSQIEPRNTHLVSVSCEGFYIDTNQYLLFVGS